jgi:putative SbcD/Mre11-related phosphoesterase
MLMGKIRIIDSEPAMILDIGEKYLVITDLHLGFESTLSSNKIFLGKSSSIKQITDNVKNLIRSENVDSIILLGDIKSSIQHIAKNEWNDIPYFFDEIKKISNVILVPGNHDANIDKLVPKEVSMISSKGLIIDDVLFTHGHTMPSENFSGVNTIVMGHIHPIFFQEDSLVNGQRVWISLRTKKNLLFPSSTGEIEIMVIPSFNPYFYVTQKRHYKKSISPIIEKIKNKSIGKIITLDGTIIGNESQLPDLL